MNKYYAAITSVLILILMGGSLYFFAFVLRFKSRVLTFFAEIDRQSMLVSEKSAREFYNYLINDDAKVLDKSKKIIEEHNQLKQSMLENQNGDGL